MVASDRESFVRLLDMAADEEAHPCIARGQAGSYTEPKVTFVFPGQGGQWLGMGRQLLATEPVFAEALAACDSAIREHGGFSVITQLHADGPESRIEEIQIVQPAIFAIQVALAALWMSWGVRPAAVAGHSMGEVVAALWRAPYVSDAARVICLRSALMRRLSGAGAMGVVGLSSEATGDAVAEFGNRLSVAASNSRNSTVISGDPEAMEALFATLQAKDVFCRRVKVNVASHSPYVDCIAAELLEGLRPIEPRPAAVPFYSTVTGEQTDGLCCDASYWMSNLRRPVLFREVVEKLLAEGTAAFIEISPHPVLESALTEAARESGRNVAVIASTRRDQGERESMLAGSGAFYVAGGSPDWAKVQPVGEPVTLPNYPWNRERFWVEADSKEAPDGRRTASCGGPIESLSPPGHILMAD